jgi:CheY-specific phosphatase CheX
MPQELERLSAADRDAGYGEILQSVCSEVLETMFFSEAMPGDCEHSWLSSAVSVRVGFIGSHVGHMCLGVSGAAAASITSAFLALDLQEIGNLEQDQVILELANILCGAVLSRLWPESRLQLDAPQLAGWESGVDAGLHCCLVLPEGHLSISVRWSATPEPL